MYFLHLKGPDVTFFILHYTTVQFKMKNIQCVSLFQVYHRHSLYFMSAEEHELVTDCLCVASVFC